MAWLLARVGWVSLGCRGSVLGCSALLVIAGGFGITRVSVNANFIDHFRKCDPVRLDTEFVDERLQGTVSIEFMLRAAERNGILEPDVLKRLEALEVFVESLPGVTSVHGLCEALREIHGVLRGGGPSAAVLPDNARLAAQLLLAMEGSGITESIVDAERRVARLTAYVRVKDSMTLASHVHEIEAFLERHFPPPLSASMTGVVKMSQDVQDYILTTQIDSLSLAVVTSVVMMGLLLGSVRLGLLAMIPNLIPLGMTLGLMGLVGISLNVGTVMIAAVVLGVIVDDTIHFLVCYRRAYGSGLSVHQAVQHTLEKVGRPIVATSLILVAGFWVMMLATFRPNVNFGLLMGVTIMIALVADLMVLPAVLAVVRPRMPRVRSGETR
jgi:predicted RND superfamily exporter protein